MEGIQFFIPADGIHVGVQPLAHVELVALQGQPLPLGQGVDHLALGPHVGDVEGHGPLHAVQVVVQAGGHRHKQRGRHPVQPQGPGQLVGKEAVAQVDGALGLINGQQGLIPLG